MENSKHPIQSRLEQWKTAASQLISGSDDKEEETIIELDPVMLDKCQRKAQERQTTVSAVINDILERYWASSTTEHEQPSISRDQLDRNPLLYLDKLSKRDFKAYGGEIHDEK